MNVLHACECRIIEKNLVLPNDGNIYILPLFNKFLFWLRKKEIVKIQ